jgi:type VI secretion system protein ImpE
VKADELIKAGRLAEALDEVNRAVRAQPGEPRWRVLLFQLNCVLGRWDKALTQLGVLADVSVETKLLAEVFRPVVQCEALRAEVFAGRRSPLIFGEPLEWVGFLVQANGLLAQGQHEAAAKLREQAFESAPAVPGVLGGKPFEWLADADMRLGPVLELVLDGKYYWVPFQRVKRIVLEPPQDLRDLVFQPAQLVWTNGGEASGHIPVRYAGSERSADAAIQLARRTDWIETPGGAATGLGQRMLATEAGEFPLLECRLIDFAASE